MAASARADVRVDFTLDTTDPDGVPIQENRYYYVYRPAGLPKTDPVPMVLVMEASPGSGAATFWHAQADRVGLVIVSCAIPGNSGGGSWNNDNPRISGFEDYDYTTAVINRVALSENCNDAFICGLSKGGHMTYSYACERPEMIRAACSVDEFMGLTSNLPTAPVPIMGMHGTGDSSVPYTMHKDTIDAWRTVNGLLNSTPVTTCEAAPLLPGRVTQVAWRGGTGGTQVAWVTIIGGGHTFATPTVQTGYDCTAGMWAFFSQFLTSTQAVPKIVSQPVNNHQPNGLPASFWVVATGKPPLTYQWRKNGADIPGATNNWLTVPAVTPADNGASFCAVVGNSSGSVTSSLATLTVTAAASDPAILAQPTNQISIAGQPVSFRVSATGSAPLSYLWKKNGMGIPGATAPSLNLPAAIVHDCGAAFTVVVTSPAGSVTSAVATLTVKPAPEAPIILRNPERSRVLTNQTGTFSVTAWSLVPMSYQWQKGALIGQMANIPGATNSTYTTPSGTLADQHTLFRCIVANAAGNATSASDMFFVTTNTRAPTDITSSLAAAGQTGVPFSYTITSSGGTVPITFTAGPLPEGLSLNPDTGLISGIPSTVGPTRVSMSASNNAGSGPTRTLAITVTDTPTLIPIGLWRSDNFGASALNPDIAGDLADPDGDGLPNLLEYATGSDPLLPGAPRWTVAIENGFLTVTAAKNPHATNVAWSADSSSDLTAWEPGDTAILQDTATSFVVHDIFPVATTPHRFLRLKVSSR